MNKKLPPHFVFSPAVARAFQLEQPIVALETAVLTHGLPFPQNIELSRALEQEVTNQGAVPATVGIIKGTVHVGLTEAELSLLGQPDTLSRKISRRDFGIAVARQENGGTTVTGTLIAACASGIKIFATGGIGGVHRDAPFDISADLPELARSQVIVVCSGAKSILDLPATVEYLETVGVPVVGYQTDEFPAFYSRSSGLPVNISVQTPEEVVAIARSHWELGMQSAILVTVPPPADVAVTRESIETVIQQAVSEAREKHIRGAAVTPFLLERVAALSGGNSLRANLALLRNNAKTAALIALSYNQTDAKIKPS